MIVRLLSALVPPLALLKDSDSAKRMQAWKNAAAASVWCAFDIVIVATAFAVASLRECHIPDDSPFVLAKYFEDICTAISWDNTAGVDWNSMRLGAVECIALVAHLNLPRSRLATSIY